MAVRSAVIRVSNMYDMLLCTTCALFEADLISPQACERATETSPKRLDAFNILPVDRESGKSAAGWTFRPDRYRRMYLHFQSVC